MRVVVLTSLCLLDAAVAVAAEPLTYDLARQRAVERAPDVLLGGAQVAVSEADVETAGALPNPTLGVASASETARLSTSLTWPLALFGQQLAAARAARRDRDVAKLEVEIARSTARWGAAKAWIDLWYAQEKAKILDGAVSDARAILDVAAKKSDAGQGPRIDVVQSRAELARAEAERAEADGAIGAAAVALGLWLAAGPDVGLSAEGEPPVAADRLPALDELRARLAKRPELLRDEAARVAAGAHVRAEERQRWPLVELQLTVNQFDPAFTGAEVVVGVAVELPILDARDGPIEHARAEEEVAKTSAALDEQRLYAEAIAAYRQAEVARGRLVAQQQQVIPGLVEVHEMTKQGFALGRFDLLHVLSAAQSVRSARLDELDARADLARALADLDHALGGVPDAP